MRLPRIGSRDTVEFRLLDEDDELDGPASVPAFAAGTAEPETVSEERSLDFDAAAPGADDGAAPAAAAFEDEPAREPDPPAGAFAHGTPPDDRSPSGGDALGALADRQRRTVRRQRRKRRLLSLTIAVCAFALALTVTRSLHRPDRPPINAPALAPQIPATATPTPLKPRARKRPQADRVVAKTPTPRPQARAAEANQSVAPAPPTAPPAAPVVRPPAPRPAPVPAPASPDGGEVAL